MIVLDTHIWVWWIRSPQVLSTKQRIKIGDKPLFFLVTNLRSKMPIQTLCIVQLYDVEQGST